MGRRKNRPKARLCTYTIVSAEILCQTQLVYSLIPSFGTQKHWATAGAPLPTASVDTLLSKRPVSRRLGREGAEGRWLQLPLTFMFTRDESGKPMLTLTLYCAMQCGRYAALGASAML